MALVATVTIPAVSVGADLTDFIVTIDLSDLGASFWATVADGGGDIRCYKADGTTELARDIESCATATDTGVLHIKYSGTLSSSSDTDIQIHADGSSADYAVTDTYGRNAVWSDYAGVYHGDDNTDSSGNQDLVPNGTDYSGNTNGILGDCFSFPGTSGQRHTAAQSSLTTDPATLQCWFYSDADANNGQGLVSAHESGGKGWFRLTNQDNQSGNPLRAQATQLNNTNSLSDTTAGVTTGVWHLGHGVFNSDGSTAVYLDGGNQVTNSTTTSITALELFAVGEWDNGAGFIQPADGYIDEARFRVGALSSDWVATEYANQSSPGTFYSVTDGGGGPSVDRTGTASLDAVASISATGTTSRSGSSSLDASAGVAVASTTHRFGSASLSAGASITAVGTAAESASGTASLDAVASISATGTTSRSGSSSLDASAGVAVASTTYRFGSASLSAGASISATGTAAAAGTGTASLDAVADISATGVAHRSGSASLSAGAGITASGIAGRIGAASLSAVAGATVSATTDRAGSAVLHALASITVLGVNPDNLVQETEYVKPGQIPGETSIAGRVGAANIINGRV